jgi:DNA-binding protein Fis
MTGWQELQRELGFMTEKDMFVELYEKNSLQKLAGMLGVSHYTLRKKLAEHNIKIRGRGGPHGVKLVEVTPALLLRIETEGVKAVALDLGISRFTLLKRKRKYLASLQPTEAEVQP